MTWNPNIEIIEGDRHRQTLYHTYLTAEMYSDDTVTRTGAFLFDRTLNEVVGSGANHFPRGVCPTEEQLQDQKWKYEHIIHAEPAAIFDAAKKGNSTKGTVMYMPWVPCTPCAKAVIDAGIEYLVGHKELIMKTPERWRESTDYALELLEKAGVKKYMYEGKIDPSNELTHLFDGEIWYP